MNSRYTNVPLIPLSEAEGNKIFPIQRSTRYPEIPKDVNDIYVITTDGDRLDLLAQQFYGNANYWWIIASGNPDIMPQNSLFIPVGLEIRIPTNISFVKSLFNTLNRI
jgi:phage tail protein X